MPLFEVAEDGEQNEFIVRIDDSSGLSAEVVNLVMEAIRLNPGWAEHWLQLAEYMVFENVEWGDA